MQKPEGLNALLKNKYSLHTTPEIALAAKRTLARTGEKVPQDPLVRIQNYLDRLNNIVNPQPLKDHPDFGRQERNLEMLKTRLHERVVIKPDEIPGSYWENQRRIIRERGQGGDLEQVDFQELKRQNTEAIIADQESSLDKWIDYFASPDSSSIPDALKYYALRSVLNMSEYDKEKKRYPERSKGTTKPFPDLNREALAYVLDALEKKYQGQKPAENNPEFEKLLQGENFAKLYGFAIEKVTPASEEALSNTQVKWVKYDQGSDHMALVKSLQGHGTGWCTAGESTARAQLNGGDFYVAYSPDLNGQFTVPRVAIRMGGNKIAEVRGIAADQNLDAGIAEEVDKKLTEFPDGLLYQKRVSDMERLTGIEQKVEAGEVLTGEDLRCLYEIDATIEGFGYSKDPRIEELRSKRNSDEDVPVVFGCSKDQIAHSLSQIRPDTKAYIGKLEAGIFNKLPKNVEHVYTSFPDGKIRRETVSIGGKTAKLLEEQLKQASVNISGYAKEMLHNLGFTANPQDLDTVKLKVSDLGLTGVATTDQIYARARDLGLELCPPEVGPYLRLQDTIQPLGDWYYIGMKQMADSDGTPSVFKLGRRDDGLWLHAPFATPGRQWDPEGAFVFCLRKETQNLGSYAK